MEAQKRAYLELHFAVLLWGFTAILGNLITLSELPLVWHRLWITCLSLLLLPGFWQQLRKVKRQNILPLVGVGMVVALHWVCFYGSIKYANISISVSCLATTSFMTSLIEPLLTRKRINWIDLSAGLLVIPGIYILFFFTNLDATTGIILGLFSAFFAAIFTTLNKMLVTHTGPAAITFVEFVGGFILLSILMPLYFTLFGGQQILPTSPDWWWLFLLSIGCTTLPFILGLRALRHISAFASTLTVNLEPVYSIILAIIIFQEDKELDNRFYLGTVIILLSVFLHPILIRRQNRKKHYRPINHNNLDADKLPEE